MRHLIIALMLTSPSFAVGQSIRVQSGEHESFSRIAFNIPEAVTWQIQETGAGVDIVFSSGDVSTDGIFSLIPRTRLKEAVAVGPRVSLEFNCNCDITSFVFQDRFLILDILDPENEATTDLVARAEAPAQLDFQEFEDWSISSPAPQPILTPTGIDASNQASAAEISPIFPKQTNIARIPEISTEDFISAIGLPEPISEAQLEIGDLGALDGQISEALAQALSEGFLEAALPRTAANENKETSNNEAVTSASVDPAQSVEVQPQIDTSKNILDAIRITKPNANLSEAIVGSRTRENFDGIACIQEEYFSGFSSLDSDFWDRKSTLSAILYNDIDSLDSEAGTELAKLLIGHGFGAEGEEILRLIEPERPDQVLADLGRLMDGGSVVQKEMWKQQISCAGTSALFGILATEEFSSGMNYSKESILMSFQKFSLPIRLYLGPRLAQRFVESGDLRFAEAFNESLVRASPQTPSAAKLSEALLLRATGNVASAEESLVLLIGERGQIGTSAILELVDLRLQEGLVFNVEEARLISSIAFAQRQSDDATELQRASIQALTSAGLYFEALDEADRLDTSFGLDEWFSQEVTNYASATEFLAIAFDPNSREIAVDAYHGFSDRLENLGFGQSSDVQIETALSATKPPLEFPSAIQIDSDGEPSSILTGASKLLQQTADLTDFVTNTFEN